MTVKFWHEENVTRTRRAQFEEDRLITLALLEYKYPKLLRYIDICRMIYYLRAVKNGELHYLRSVLTHPIALLKALVIKCL